MKLSDAESKYKEKGQASQRDAPAQTIEGRAEITPFLQLMEDGWVVDGLARCVCKLDIGSPRHRAMAKVLLELANDALSEPSR